MLNRLGDDKRTLRVGLILSACCFFAAFGGRFAPIEHHLAIVFPIYLWGDDAGGLISDASALVGYLILPGVMSAIAYRRAFFWGLLPLMTGQVFWIIDSAVEHKWRVFSATVQESTLVALMAWGIVSGLVCLIRLAVHRWKQARQKCPVTVPPEAIWPPSPNSQS